MPEQVLGEKNRVVMSKIMTERAENIGERRRDWLGQGEMNAESV